ncbi:MAG: transglutaminase family protein [Planctomycetota bacterium]|nr:transglutaminase family protein [Planctomycetota bacterium]
MRPHTPFKLTGGLRSRFLSSFLTACVLVACPGSWLPAEDTETARQGDEWHMVHLQGKPAGYSLLRKLEGENGELETVSFTRITMKRGTQKTTVEERLEIREDAAGKILGFRKEEKKAQQAVTTVGKMIASDRMELEVSSGNSPARKQVIPFNPATRGFPHTTKKISSALKKKGDRVEVLVFMSDLSRCIRQVSTLQAREGKLRRIESRLELAPGNSLVLLEWINDEGQSVRSSMPYLGMETVLSSREKIVATDFSSPPEIFFSSGIPLGRFLGWKREEILYKLSLRDSKQPVRLTDSGAAGHKLTATKEEGSWHLRVQTVRQDAARDLPLSPTPSLKLYLSSTAYIQSDDARIIELTKKAAGNKKNSLEVARILEKWVYNYIRKKNLGTAFATAKEVLETRQGDCTEHAVLLAAMCRAAGIPSRVVAGLVYYRKSFVGHMWTEVYTGKWVPLDATIGKGKVEADHIALAVSALDNTSISEIFIGLLPFLGNMEIEVLETR